MPSKHPACDTTRVPRPQQPAGGPDPHVERRLRTAFPEVWARYEWLLAARAMQRRPRRQS